MLEQLLIQFYAACHAGNVEAMNQLLQNPGVLLHVRAKAIESNTTTQGQGYYANNSAGVPLHITEAYVNYLSHQAHVRQHNAHQNNLMNNQSENDLPSLLEKRHCDETPLNGDNKRYKNT